MSELPFPSYKTKYVKIAEKGQLGGWLWFSYTDKVSV